MSADAYLQETSAGHELQLTYDKICLECFDKMVREGMMTVNYAKPVDQILADLTAVRQLGWKTATDSASLHSQHQDRKQRL